MTIALVFTGVALLAIFGWMASLAGKKRRQTEERIERERSYRRAMEKQRSEERKERLFKAETGHVPTQLYLAKEAELKNPREALYWYEQAAMRDSEIAMYGVVRVCARAKEDVVLAEKSKFWQLAIEAHNGNLLAKLEMGKALIGGKGVDQNLEKGIKIVEEVANMDNIQAQIYMGDWYVAESNMQPNPKLSAEWLFKAAQQNDAEAQIKLGEHYRDGVGVARNITRATYWYEVAGEQGNAEAQYYAGDIWIGRGNKGDAIAYFWLFLSSYFGHESAKAKRDDVGNIIGVDAVVGLQGMAKPLLKKLENGKITKHTMIKALNKLYKREEYFPEVHGNEFMVYEKPNYQESKSSESAGETPSEPDFNFSFSPLDKDKDR